MVGTDRQVSGTAEQSGIESLVTLWDDRGMEGTFFVLDTSELLTSFVFSRFHQR